MLQRKLKIVHLTAASIWRGAEQQIVQLYQHLEEQCEQVIYCPKKSELGKYGLNHHFKIIEYHRESGLNFSLAKQILQIEKIFQPDLFHVHDPHALNAFIIAQLLGLKTKAVVHRRVDFPLHNGLFSKYKWNHNSILKIISVSDAVSKVLQPYIKDTSKLTTIYDGVEIKDYQVEKREVLQEEFPICKGKILVGNIAALVDHKDYPTFLKTAAIVIHELKRNDIHFFIIGKGAEENLLKALCAELKLDAHITFTGFRNNIPFLIKNLDYLLFTSKMEGLGSTLLQCMAGKLPIIGTTAGGVQEILFNEYNALTAEPGDAYTLSQQLLRFIQETDLKTQIVNNAFEFVQKYSAANNASQTFQTYLSVLHLQP